MAMMKHSRLLACMKYQSLVFPCQLLHALGVLFVLLLFFHLSEINTNYNTVDSNVNLVPVMRLDTVTVKGRDFRTVFCECLPI